MRALRPAAWLGALVATAALAHLVPTATFSTPSGAGNLPEPDGGTFEIRWTDGEPPAETTLELYASPVPIPPLTAPGVVASAGILLNRTELRLADPVNAYDWSTRRLAPGCYHIVGIATDYFEQVMTLAPGVVTVPAPDDVPPSLWLSDTDEVAPDGTFLLHFQVSDPEDPQRVSISYGRNGPSGLTLIEAVRGLEFPPGTHDGSFLMSFEDAGYAYYSIYAEVSSGHDAGCATYRRLPLLVPGPFTRAADAGAEPPDAGLHGAKGGCGCTSGSAGLGGSFLLAALLGGRRRLRSRGRQRSMPAHLN